MNFDDKQHNDAFLLVLDIDFFKKVNDAYGHSTGDDVLIAAVKIMTQAIRQDDLIGRIGGEEFAIFLSDTSNKNRNTNQLRKWRFPKYNLGRGWSRYVPKSTWEPGW